ALPICARAHTVDEAVQPVAAGDDAGDAGGDPALAGRGEIRERGQDHDQAVPARAQQVQARLEGGEVVGVQDDVDALAAGRLTEGLAPVDLVVRDRLGPALADPLRVGGAAGGPDAGGAGPERHRAPSTG